MAVPCTGSNYLRYWFQLNSLRTIAAPSAFGTCLSSSALTWTLPPSAGGIVVTTVPVAVAAR